MRYDNYLGRSEDDEHAKTLEISKIKKEIETADKIFYDKLTSKYFLLDKFQYRSIKRDVQYSPWQTQMQNIIKKTNLQSNALT